MLRFIFNFFIFGLLFYAIWIFFPDTFTHLVNWAGSVFNGLKDAITALMERLNGWRGSTIPAHPIPALLLGLLGRK